MQGVKLDFSSDIQKRLDVFNLTRREQYKLNKKIKRQNNYYVPSRAQRGLLKVRARG